MLSPNNITVRKSEPKADLHLICCCCVLQNANSCSFSICAFVTPAINGISPLMLQVRPVQSAADRPPARSWRRFCHVCPSSSSTHAARSLNLAWRGRELGALRAAAEAGWLHNSKASERAFVRASVSSETPEGSPPEVHKAGIAVAVVTVCCAHRCTSLRHCCCCCCCCFCCVMRCSSFAINTCPHGVSKIYICTTAGDCASALCGGIAPGMVRQPRPVPLCSALPCGHGPRAARSRRNTHGRPAGIVGCRCARVCSRHQWSCWMCQRQCWFTLVSNANEEGQATGWQTPDV